jgi:hypothetical protein
LTLFLGTNIAMSISFGMRHWEYQSFLVLPTDSENAEKPGSRINALKWAKGTLHLEDAIDNKPDVVGTLEFPTDEGPLRLTVTAVLDQGDIPAKFNAIGEVKEANKAKGARYELIGWAFPGKENKVAKITGSIRAVSGPDKKRDTELGGMPIGTVGFFTITNPR